MIADYRRKVVGDCGDEERDGFWIDAFREREEGGS
jgi:hypothetical protein